MELHGKNLIGGRTSADSSHTYQAKDPARDSFLPGDFHDASQGEIDTALGLAANAAQHLRRQTSSERAAFLEGMTEEIAGVGEPLLERCMAETGLPEARIKTELGRTLNQIRMFAELVKEGSWVEARIDRAIPDREPLPKPDIRQMLVPIGPVAVFGASNFPLAFSVAGGDTASAFAGGNPVIVKVHPSHPGTSELVGEAIVRAVKKSQLPEGTFTMLHGSRVETGLTLVRHAGLRAVGFTGSLRAGRALYDAAAARPQPIPVFAEMGSINPLFVLPGALKDKGEQIAAGLVQSFTMGTGQFCTKPGVVYAVDGDATEKWITALADTTGKQPAGCMLNDGILRNYQSGVEKRKGGGAVHLVTAGADDAHTAQPALFRTDLKTFLAEPELHEELFGPTALVVTAPSLEELEEAALRMDGQLTASLHGTEEDLQQAGRLVSILEEKAGRLIFNGFPTGVEVCPSMQHGGPFPASTDSRFTSVGTAAIRRFIRPVCYQNFPDDALPRELRNANEGGIWRLVDGSLTRDSL